MHILLAVALSVTIGLFYWSKRRLIDLFNTADTVDYPYDVVSLLTEMLTGQTKDPIKIFLASNLHIRESRYNLDKRVLYIGSSTPETITHLIVAAHEGGHAIQHDKGLLLLLRPPEIVLFFLPVLLCLNGLPVIRSVLLVELASQALKLITEIDAWRRACQFLQQINFPAISLAKKMCTAALTSHTLIPLVALILLVLLWNLKLFGF